MTERRENSDGGLGPFPTIRTVQSDLQSPEKEPSEYYKSKADSNVFMQIERSSDYFEQSRNLYYRNQNDLDD